MSNFEKYTPDWNEFSTETIHCYSCGEKVIIPRYAVNERSLREKIYCLEKIIEAQDKYINLIHKHFGRQFIKERLKQ